MTTPGEKTRQCRKSRKSESEMSIEPLGRKKEQENWEKSRKSENEMPNYLVWQFLRKTRQCRKIKEKWKWNANWGCQRAPEYEQPAIKFATAAQYLI